MIIGKIDPAETVTLQRRLKRNESLKRRLALLLSSAKFPGTDRNIFVIIIIIFFFI